MRIYSSDHRLAASRFLFSQKKAGATWLRGRNGWQGQKYCRLTLHLTGRLLSAGRPDFDLTHITNPLRLLAAICLEHAHPSMHFSPAYTGEGSRRRSKPLIYPHRISYDTQNRSFGKSPGINVTNKVVRDECTIRAFLLATLGTSCIHW